MSTKRVIASYVVELTEDANGSQSITVIRQAPSEGSFVPPVTATYLGIYATIRKLLNELLSTSESRLLYRC
jgi:hypothetical protein